MAQLDFLAPWVLTQVLVSCWTFRSAALKLRSMLTTCVCVCFAACPGSTPEQWQDAQAAQAGVTGRDVEAIYRLRSPGSPPVSPLLWVQTGSLLPLRSLYSPGPR